MLKIEFGLDFCTQEKIALYTSIMKVGLTHIRQHVELGSYHFQYSIDCNI